jgi:alkylation response protein AidB-like acyl-CoA dehydrogenase
MAASSSTTGFFQPSPRIPPQYEDDVALRRIISIYLPSPLPESIHNDLARLSRVVLSQPMLSYMTDAERNLPSVQPLTAFGMENKVNPLITSEGWRKLQDIGIQEGMVGLGYESPTTQRCNLRIYQFVKYHLWMGSCCMSTCPSGMTDGAATLLGRHLDDVKSGIVFTEARRRLISRQPGVAWTSGQWMTERSGGSDVRQTETLARRLTAVEMKSLDEVDSIGMPLGDWSVDGFKWFSSATDGDMTILLARTVTHDGISAFYAPMRKTVRNGKLELNGIRIQRLKDKIGTKPVPTAELELKGLRAYLIGKEGDGIKEISMMLKITRVHNMMMALGAWGRGLAVSRAYAKVRESGKKLLADIPAFVRGLASEHVKYRAQMHLAFLTAALLGASEWRGKAVKGGLEALILPQDPNDIDLFLRLLTPVAKAQTALASVAGLRFCMESLGGIGYLENHEDPLLNISRLLRDTCVTAIWEGTSDIMADDLVRVLRGPQGPAALAVLDRWINNTVSGCRKTYLSKEAEYLQLVWQTWFTATPKQCKEIMKYNGRDSIATLDLVISGCCLLFDALRDRDDVATEVARRWIWGDKM